jgi:uncharacterized protein YhhL (DUF1145 family)
MTVPDIEGIDESAEPLRPSPGKLWAGGIATAVVAALLETPRPLSFFVWITGLADLIAVAAPFAQPAALSSKVFTAVINLVAGVAVISLLTGVAASAIRTGGITRLPASPGLQRR